MADTEQVSSTTANEVEEAPKVQELGTGDFIDNEAAVKVVEEETEMPSETLLHSGSTSKQLTELSAPPEEPQTVEVISAPEPEAPASVTSTVGDATEQLTKEEEEEVAVTSTHKADAVPETLDVKSEPEKKQIEELAEKVISLEAEVSEQVVSAAPVVETVITAPIVEPEETFKATAVEEPSAAPAKEPPSAPAPSYEPAVPSAPSQPLMQFSSEHWDSQFVASQANTKVSMDSFTKDTASRSASGVDPDMLSHSDDDFMFETKKNPFQGFSPVDNPSDGFSHLEETTTDSRRSKMSESPTPDLVQYSHEGEMLDDLLKESEKPFHSTSETIDSLRQQLIASDLFTSATKEDDNPAAPTSLPDILKSYPLNPEKLDSGSSEGSPDISPVHREGSDSPNAPFSMSANNPFAFNTKISLLKEMAEETEARAAENEKSDEKPASEQSFGSFDLVKETQPPLKIQEPLLGGQKDVSPPGQGSAQMVDRFECLNFPAGKAQEQSDSESPSADSLSPVLEAMARNPASFQVESEKKVPKEEPEATDEVSEQEVSSEEFEFVEKPPRGAIDEFLETLDNSKFSKASEMVLDNDDFASKSGQGEIKANTSEESQEKVNQSSYLLLTEPSDKASAQRGKAGLEVSDIPMPVSQPSVAHSPAAKTEVAEPVTEKKEEPKAVKTPNLNAEAVVDLLYWRDVKTTGVVFGASLLLLLSLSVCSIISVFSYVALALLSVTIIFRIYKGILQAIQKSDEGHPFKLYLDQDLALSEDLVHKYSDLALGRINSSIRELRRLFLVEDLVDSLKFAVFMWILTYVGALFNGLTLLILGLVSAFSLPIIYEKHQTQIDQYIALVNNQIKDIIGKIQAKVPGLKKKTE
ncbi:reticulon-4b isoform X1 [Chanos chanos]|uniref:Reticulon n=1 Tax=Chanos chanos TaxID=29144 RepID=A0A6J2V4E6_CHACN|nr:reticulon-4-like isoform X1 [Chanos chanos]